MKRLIPIALATAFTCSSAFAQTTPAQPKTDTPTPPAVTAPPSSMPSTPPSATQPTPAPSATQTSDNMKLTDEQARAWLNKPVYSSDGKSLGHVAVFSRDASGKVTELHADIGGFLGLGQTRVRLMPAQFSLGPDRINIKMTAEQAKALPKLEK